METPILGAKIEALDGSVGIIIDKAHGHCNGASPTVYICMTDNGDVFEVAYDEIKKIVKFITHPESDYSRYIENK
jgi:hypothetical protein